MYAAVYAVQNMAPPPLCPTSPALPVDEEAQASVDAIRRIASFKGGYCVRTTSPFGVAATCTNLGLQQATP